MKVTVEIADTPQKLARGLMFRDKLPDDHGMLFIFDHNQPMGFWGRNTFIPLDIAFITAEGQIAGTGHIRKHSENPVRCLVPCLMALEVNEGFFKRHGISVGDQIVVEKKDDNWVVAFEKGDGKLKIADRRYIPKDHPFLPNFNIPAGNFAAPPKPKKRVPKPRGWEGQPMLPFSDMPIQAPAGAMPNDQNTVNPAGLSPTQPTGFGDEGIIQPEDDSQLPVVGVEDIPFADDDDHAQDQEQQEQGVPADQETIDQQKGDEALEDDGAVTYRPPDITQMSVPDALKYAEDKGLVLWIDYVTAPKKRTIGPLKVQREIHRVVQPHGQFHAKTTHNQILVTYDMSVGSIRAFIVDRIKAKGLTGQTFTKFFRVKG